MCDVPQFVLLNMMRTFDSSPQVSSQLVYIRNSIIRKIDLKKEYEKPPTLT